MAVENRERIAWAVMLLGVQPADHVLEIGFGPGIAIERLASIVHLVAGVDVSEVMVAQASRRNAAAIRAGRVDLTQGSAGNLPYLDQQFDRVLAINSLHIWSAPQTGLHEIHRVLKPGGLRAGCDCRTATIESGRTA
jgi:ubiquinone/menaquinone biosynthesis C-methylase UbiE